MPARTLTVVNYIVNDGSESLRTHFLKTMIKGPSE